MQCIGDDPPHRTISDAPFLLSQMDVQFDTSYGHLKSAMQGFLHGWYVDCGKAMVVDKDRAWLPCFEFLLHLEPQALLLDFIDHLAEHDRLRRADLLFAADKSIGAPLSSIQAVQDLPQGIRDRIFFVRFEDLVRAPVQTMDMVYQWLGLGAHSVDPMHLQVRPHESDSHFHHKYLHRQHASITVPATHEVPKRVQELIHGACSWYCDWFYPAPAPTPRAATKSKGKAK